MDYAWSRYLELGIKLLVYPAKWLCRRSAGYRYSLSNICYLNVDIGGEGASYAMEIETRESMNVREIVEFINDMEARYPVDQWRIDDIEIWPHLRIQIYFKLYETYCLAQVASFSKSCRFKSFVKNQIFFIKEIVDFIFACILHPLQMRFLLKKSDALFVDDLSYVFLDKSYFQRFCDPIIDNLSKRGKHSYLLSTYNNFIFPRKTPAKFIGTGLRVRLKVAALINNNPAVENMNGFDSFYQDMLKYDHHLSVYTIDKMRRDARSIKIISSSYKDIIKKIEPRAIFLVSYYNLYGMGLLHAASSFGIPTIDLQHGVTNRLHIAYGLWNRVPLEGYNVLPKIFACWENDSAKVIKEWGNNLDSGTHSSRVTGNLFLQKIIKEKRQSQKFSTFFDKIQSEKKPTKNILLTLQSYSLPDLFLEVMSVSSKEYFWWIRLHPMMMDKKNDVSSVLSSKGVENFELEECSSAILYEIMPRFDVHVTLNSSVVIEAREFGIPSIVCDETAREYYGEHINNGQFVLAMSPTDILNAIEVAKPLDKPSYNFSNEQFYEELGL